MITLQGSRLEDQRSSLPGEGDPELDLCQPTRGPTVPDEDFFSLIMRLQSGRMEDQRASVPTPPPLLENRMNNVSSKPSTRKDKKK